MKKEREKWRKDYGNRTAIMDAKEDRDKENILTEEERRKKKDKECIIYKEKKGRERTG